MLNSGKEGSFGQMRRSFLCGSTCDTCTSWSCHVLTDDVNQRPIQMAKLNNLSEEATLECKLECVQLGVD